METVAPVSYTHLDVYKRQGQKNWQVLPLGQTSYGDSPYQSFSSFAGNPYFIDLEQLVEQQLLTKAECDSFDFGKNPESIDYAKLYQNRYKILRMACDRFLKPVSYTHLDVYKRQVISLVETLIQNMEERLAASKDGARNEVAQAKSYIYEHYSEDISVEKLSELVYLSPGYFSYIFKKETGDTVSRFIRNYRMEQAKKLLSDTSMKIVQI